MHLGATPLEKPDDLSIGERQILSDIPLTYEVVRDAAMSTTVKKFVYMSSVFAYGNYSGSISEDAPLDPVTLYGASKATGEHIIKTLLKEKDWIIIRTTSLYGFGDANLRVADIFINKALKGEKFWVNGSANLDFIYIKDFIDGMVKAIEKNIGKQALHISGGHAVKLTQLVKELKKHFPDIKYEMKNNVNDRPSRGTMNNLKAKRKLGWKPKFSLAEGISDNLKYIKPNIKK